MTFLALTTNLFISDPLTKPKKEFGLDKGCIIMIIHKLLLNQTYKKIKTIMVEEI